jgi:outer membrane protein assembly factor BamB
MRVTGVILALPILLIATTMANQDWNQWRGPARTGATSLFRPPGSWPDRPRQVWKVEVGTGHASPVVAGGRVFQHSRIAEQEIVSAFDLTTGKEVWRQTYDAPYGMNPAAVSHGKGPKSTPLYDRGRLFTLGIGGILSAWDAKTGRLSWRQDFRADYKTTAPDFGVAMSPASAGDLLVVHVGGSGGGAILAMEQSTGVVRWSWKGDGPAYASPVAAEFGAVTQLVTQSQKYVLGLAVADGRLLWRMPFTTDYDQNIVTPVISGDLLVYGGLSKPTTAVRITQRAGKWTEELVWQNPEIPLYMSSPVEAAGKLYGLTHRNRGQFFCVDVKSGRTLWTTRGREAENAALVVAGDLLIATTTEAELVVARVNPTSFDLVKRYTIAESPIWAHPVLTASGVIIKDAETLAYWEF